MLGLCALGGFIAVLPIFARDQLGAGPRGMGFMLSGMGVGAALGALAVTHAGRRWDKLWSIAGGAGIGAVALWTVAPTTHLGLAIGGTAVLGWGVVFLLVPAYALLQEETPQALVGRVVSLAIAALSLAQVLGMGVVGAAATRARPRHLLGAEAILLGVAALVFSAWIFLRRPRRPDGTRDTQGLRVDIEAPWPCSVRAGIIDTDAGAAAHLLARREMAAREPNFASAQVDTVLRSRDAERLAELARTARERRVSLHAAPRAHDFQPVQRLAGGMKVLRIMLLTKFGQRQLFQLAHPRAVTVIKLGERAVPEDVVYSVWGFYVLYVATALALTLAIMATGLDLESAFGAVAATINVLGPGLGEVATTFTTVSPVAKWLAVLAMLVGRLEVFTVLILFMPAYWRR